MDAVDVVDAVDAGNKLTSPGVVHCALPYVKLFAEYQPHRSTVNTTYICAVPAAFLAALWQYEQRRD